MPDSALTVMKTEARVMVIHRQPHMLEHETYTAIHLLVFGISFQMVLVERMFNQQLRGIRLEHIIHPPREPSQRDLVPSVLIDMFLHPRSCYKRIIANESFKPHNLIKPILSSGTINEIILPSPDKIGPHIQKRGQHVVKILKTPQPFFVEDQFNVPVLDLIFSRLSKHKNFLFDSNLPKTFYTSIKLCLSLRGCCYPNSDSFHLFKNLAFKDCSIFCSYA